MNKFILSASVLALLVSNFSNAGAILPVDVDGDCKLNSVQITAITPVLPAGDNIVAPNTAIDSTSCLGFVITPENDWGNNTDPNMGGLYDGLLNGEEVEGKGQDDNSYYIESGLGETFLTHDDDKMVNLDGIGPDDDPGWIRLGGAENKSEGEWNFVYDSIGDFNLESVITMSFFDYGFDEEGTKTEGGTWILAVDPSAILAATIALGRPSIFDHLAFVMKGPNNDKEGGSWAIYDFNFHVLMDDVDEGGVDLDISLGDTAYTFEGTWDKDLFGNADALSHMSVWAHDPPLSSPPGPNDIPEPSILAIFALSIIALASRRLKQQS